MVNEEDKREFESQIDKLLEGTIVKVDDDPSMGQEMQEIAKELTKDENVFRFGNPARQTIGWDSLLGALGERPNYNPNIKPRYAFIQCFRFIHAVNRSAIKSAQAERYKDLGSSLLGFQGALQYRGAGVPGMEEEKKHSLLDKIRKK